MLDAPLTLAFTFATNSEHNLETTVSPYGKYPVKLYKSSSVLIHQDDIGGDNRGKQPSGGILSPLNLAGSMNETVANPVTFYGGDPWVVVNQVGQSADLYNYYFASYSRGIDGGGSWGNGNSEPNLHNLYLDSYIPLRHKSIYDPCPYGYRVPSNGTYNEFTNTGWTAHSYVGGTVCNLSWFPALGSRYPSKGVFYITGSYANYRSATRSAMNDSYSLEMPNGGISLIELGIY